VSLEKSDWKSCIKKPGGALRGRYEDPTQDTMKKEGSLFNAWCDHDKKEWGALKQNASRIPGPAGFGWESPRRWLTSVRTGEPHVSQSMLSWALWRQEKKTENLTPTIQKWVSRVV